MVDYWLVVVGQEGALRQNLLYTFIVVDNNEHSLMLQAFGIDKNTDSS